LAKFLSLLELGPKGGVHGPKKIFFFPKTNFFSLKKVIGQITCLKQRKTGLCPVTYQKRVFFQQLGSPKV
jgi:hypothetical protein